MFVVYNEKQQQIDKQFNECQTNIKNLKAEINNILKSRKQNVLRSNAMKAEQKNGVKTQNSGANANADGLFKLIPNAAFRVRRRLPGHFGKMYALHWASNSRDLVSASQDGKLLVWNCLTSNKKIAIPLRSAWVMTCAYSPSGDFVASGGLDNICSVFNIKDCPGWEVDIPYRELEEHEGYLSCVRFVDDNQILSASGDAQCILWDVDKQTNILQFNGHASDVESISINYEKHIFVSGSIDATSKIWDIRTSATHGAIATFQGHQTDINTVCWFPDGNAFVSGSDDSAIRLYDLRAHQELNCYRDLAISSTVTEVDFTKSGYYLVAGYDEDPYCLVWNTMTSEKLYQLEHPKRASCVQTAPNGHAIATGSWDKILRVWA